jgi:hypothetical protein
MLPSPEEVDEIGRRDAAQRPPVLLLHGFSLGAELSWVAPGTLDSLATRYTVTEHQLGSIGIPPLAVVEEAGHLARPAAVERMAGVLPGLEVVVVPGAHHLSTTGTLCSSRRYAASRIPADRSSPELPGAQPPGDHPEALPSLLSQGSFSGSRAVRVRSLPERAEPIILFVEDAVAGRPVPHHRPGLPCTRPGRRRALDLRPSGGDR